MSSMTDASITHRQLTRKEAGILSEEIKQTPGITGYLPEQLMRIKDVLILESNGNFIGAFCYTETNHFIERKLLLIREKYRGKGYGTQLLGRFAVMYGSTSKPIYAVTKNPITIELLCAAGYVKVPFRKLPVRIILNQIMMIFSVYRIREYVRKQFAFPGSGEFSYWIKY
jgi:N-acetylglutamate synthase-like GNAT family acetyltransferase